MAFRASFPRVGGRLALALLLAAAWGDAVAQEEPAAPRAVRPIAPDLVAPPLVDPDGLRRDEPRAPLSEIGPAGAPAARPRQPDAPIFRPVATAAGRLEGGGMVVALAGIEIVEPDHTCRRPDGSAWPCGAHARTAFRSFLRARAVDCDLPEGAVPARLSASCTVGGQDLGAWLVMNGWAKVTLDGPYAEEQRAAIEAGRGIFGPGPEALSEAVTGGASSPPRAEEQPGLETPTPRQVEPEPGAGTRPRVTVPPGGAGLY